MNEKNDGKTLLSKFGTAIVSMLVGFFRWIIDNTVHGIFAVLNCGSKTRIPKVDNDLLLEPAVQLAAKIRRGEVRFKNASYNIKTYNPDDRKLFSLLFAEIFIISLIYSQK